MDRQISKSQLIKERRKRMLKIGAGVVAGVVAVVAVIMSLETTVSRNDIRLGVADRGPLETTINATGRVAAAYEEIVNSPVDSRIVEVFAQAGDTVEAGTPLLRLDLESAETTYEKMVNDRNIRSQELTQLRLNNSTQLSELAMQIEVKEMEVNRLKVDVENERRLDSLGSGTGERVRQAETAYTSARLELRQLNQRLTNERLRDRAAEKVEELGVNSNDKDLEQMRRTLERGRIPAPHAGVLTYIAKEIGSQVSPGQRLAVVSDLSRFRVDGQAPEASAERFGVGSEVSVRLGSTELKGIVTNVTPRSTDGVISFTVGLDDPRNPRLRAGLRAELYISYGYKEDVVRIPNGRYFKGAGEYDLFVLDGTGRLKRRHVTLGDSNRDFVEVVTGLEPGDSVVISDTEKFKSKKSLKIK